MGGLNGLRNSMPPQGMTPPQMPPQGMPQMPPQALAQALGRIRR